jgi:hypothetical protein
MFNGSAPAAEPFVGDVQFIRADGAQARYSAAEPTALSRGALLRDLSGIAKPGDTLVLNPTDFDLDGKNRGTLLFPDGVTVTSPGLAKLSSNVYSDDQGAAFEIKSGAFQNISFANHTWKTDEDGQTLKFFTGAKRTPDNAHIVLLALGVELIDTPAGSYVATFNKCEFVGNAWTVYDWSGKGNRWKFEDCRFFAGRQCLSMMHNGDTRTACEAIRCTFDVDASRSADIGATSNRTFGGIYAVIARSGTMRLVDCEFRLKGKKSEYPSWTPRCVGVFDGHHFGSISDGRTLIEILNCRFLVDGNGATDVFDVFITNEMVRESLKVVGGSGSGPGGTILKNW